jgi:hypothetical protein|nr:MAG TPA: hypothetical protein [Caudoviricetes sp.]
MKFKGTIIITDPCYIIKDMNDRLKEAGITVKYPSYNDDKDISEYQREVNAYRALVDPYDDWKTCEYGSHMERLGFSSFISEPTIYGDWSCTTWSTPRKDVEVQLEELNKLSETAWKAIEEYGRDSVQSKIYDDKMADATVDMKKLGVFCADAGMVAVFLLEEVLIYNPDFSKWIEEHPWCVTVIPDFDGDIQYHIDEDGDAHIIGKGNINFLTSQTGL